MGRGVGTGHSKEAIAVRKTANAQAKKLEATAHTLVQPGIVPRRDGKPLTQGQKRKAAAGEMSALGRDTPAQKKKREAAEKAAQVIRSAAWNADARAKRLADIAAGRG